MEASPQLPLGNQGLVVLAARKDLMARLGLRVPPVHS